MGALVVHALALGLMAAMVALCMRRSPALRTDGPRVYLVHPAWTWFMVLGAGLLIGIFAVAGRINPANAATTVWCSVAAAALFGFNIVMFARIRAVVDGSVLTYRTIFWSRTVDLRTVHTWSVEAMSLTLTFHPPAPGQRPPRPLRMLAAFGHMRSLLDDIEQAAAVNPRAAATAER